MPKRQDEPVELHVRIFQADDGWRWRISGWVGNVDVRNTEPAHTEESKRAFVRRAGAIKNAIATLDTSEVR